MYYVTKTYGHECGLSAVFRQWRAESHCRFLHGYPLSFALTFGAEMLDQRGWVINFGGLKPVKAYLEETFDHKLLVAADDPKISPLLRLGEAEMAQVVLVPGVGCEAFAKLVYEHAAQWLAKSADGGRVKLLSVRCAEHAGNSATYDGGF